MRRAPWFSLTWVNAGISTELLICSPLSELIHRRLQFSYARRFRLEFLHQAQDGIRMQSSHSLPDMRRDRHVCRVPRYRIRRELPEQPRRLLEPAPLFLERHRQRHCSALGLPQRRIDASLHHSSPLSLIRPVFPGKIPVSPHFTKLNQTGRTAVGLQTFTRGFEATADEAIGFN